MKAVSARRPSNRESAENGNRAGEAQLPRPLLGSLPLEPSESTIKKVVAAVGEWIEKTDLMQKAESGEGGLPGASCSSIPTAAHLRSPETEQLLEILDRFVKEEAEDGGEASPPSSPPPRRSLDRLLRYSSYSASSPLPAPSNRKDDRKSKPFDPALRERIALGGRGGVGESLLGEGALEKVRGEEGFEWRDGEKESDGEEEAEDGKTPMQRSPPADLLIELKAVNPFHDGI
ncbi:hypothetical protein BCR35DRAFT_335827 [Leucosporidium creatinivorum]|uniref:Uncharacterized protein n=1 Tax=Leucosporidium creatinivorum TaxID=106004 RepID=A0A1Y2D5A7_9BASI|nr:hypothetical protein BCR35DRAFT_335827 [Leucosporidium creatinivorum]